MWITSSDVKTWVAVLVVMGVGGGVAITLVGMMIYGWLT